MNNNIKDIFLIILASVLVGVCRVFFLEDISFIKQAPKLISDDELVNMQLDAPKVVTMSQSKQMFDDKSAVFIDARDSLLYDDGHILGAINIHFESIGLSKKDSLFLDKDFLSLNTKILKTFNKQNIQVNKIIDFLSEIEIPTIICSDLNNNAFSIPYKKISMKNKDAFVEAGNGFGNTYFFGFFPLRIDYIFVDKSLKVLSFSTFEENLSDHNPIMAKIDFN